MKYLLIAAGGAAGSICRYLAATFIMTRVNPKFPLGTVLVNISGCFLIGIIMTILTERYAPNSQWRPLLVVGFLGGYTTFSSFEWETYVAVQTDAMWIAAVNLIGSVVVGFAAVWLGALLVKR